MNVIPAQAGIQVYLPKPDAIATTSSVRFLKQTLDSRLRRNDVLDYVATFLLA
jgi:hypothetical protein